MEPVFRSLPNGYLVAEGRSVSGLTAPEGYEVSLEDPHLFLPVMRPCEVRGVSAKECCGGRLVEKLVCGLKGEEVTRARCLECKRV